tara:strand:+ start:170021 stop:170563 length:543 start_codon:yes stop_codon:yes gene_type:complete
MRRLTLEEAELVSSAARGDGNRPSLYRVTSGFDEEISADFETFLILNSIDERTQVSQFFQTVLENDPNSNDNRDRLLAEYVSARKANEEAKLTRMESFSEIYDETKSTLQNMSDGFEDITEVDLLNEATNTALGGIVEQRDRFSYDLSVLTVLEQAVPEGGISTLRRELESWGDLLVEYD